MITYDLFSVILRE